MATTGAHPYDDPETGFSESEDRALVDKDEAGLHSLTAEERLRLPHAKKRLDEYTDRDYG